jgi:hypothetical protein
MNCELCGGKLDGGACPLCGEARELSDRDLDHVVGGMAVVSGISLGLGLLRLIQGVRARRERSASRGR